MNRISLILAFLLLAIPISAAYSKDLPTGEMVRVAQEAAGVLKVKGTVTKVEDGVVFLKINDITTRTFSVKAEKKEGIKSLKPGDRVTLRVDEGNQIVDIDKGGYGSKQDKDDRR
ncbi:hypothetical protein EPO44_01645 [bacterium]|nr:MAG: hypothetical protein EPO44_01645 [bacterium]